MKKLNYLFLTICMLAIGTWSHAQCTGSGGFLANQGASAFCAGDATNIVLAVASAPAQGDVSGYSWVITNADISMSNDPTNSATLVAALPITDMPTVTLEAVISDYVSDAGTYYITSVAFGNGTWTGMDMETLADVTLDPDCTFSSASTEIEFGGSGCPPSNDACSGAIDLSAGLGQGVGVMTTSGPYDNTNATVNADESDAGLDACFGEPGFNAPVILNNPIWFKIIGDGSFYTVRASSTECASDITDPIEDNDTQIAIYTGDCAGLTLVACNEDSPEATAGDYFSDVDLQTEAGVEYLILVDGFDCSDPSCGGGVSAGEFCMTVTEQEPEDPVTCADASVGELSADLAVACFPDTIVNYTITSAVAPNVGDLAGALWVISTEDLQGSIDPANASGYLTAFSTNNAEDGLELNFSGVASNTYYAALYIYGEAVWTNGTPNGQLDNVTFDPNCTFISNTIPIMYYADGECPPDAVLDINEDVLGMTIFPNPAQDVVNLNINTAEYSEATIMISNVVGQMIQQQIVNLQSGENIFSIDLDNAPAGVYMVSVETSSHQSVSRFLKQ